MIILQIMVSKLYPVILSSTNRYLLVLLFFMSTTGFAQQIDIKKFQKDVWIFAIVGLNPLFIYLFAHVGGADLILKIVLPFSNALFGWTGELTAQIFLGLIVLFFLWYITYWMYKKKIFIRI